MKNWTPATDQPGYRCKTVQRGPAIITIYRPILNETEEAKAQAKARSQLESALREHYKRRTKEAAATA